MFTWKSDEAYNILQLKSNSTKKASWLEKICKSFVEMGKSDSVEKLGVVSLEAGSKQPGWV